jgi:hypothetical protein
MTKRSQDKFNGEGPTRLKSWQAGAQPFGPAPPVLRMNRARARFTSSALPSRSEYWRICRRRTGRIDCATKTGRRVIMIVVLLVALLASVAMRASATTLERMSVAKMTQAAQLVVRAQCVANSTGWDGGEIWTFTSFTVEDAWKGAPSGTAQQLTGRVGGKPELHRFRRAAVSSRRGSDPVPADHRARRLFHCELGAGNISHSSRRAQRRGDRRARYGGV